jgi:hypothetical protein
MFKISTDPPPRKRKIADLENLGRSGGATELKLFRVLVDACIIMTESISILSIA